jgi:RHS repeat-associated protein
VDRLAYGEGFGLLTENAEVVDSLVDSLHLRGSLRSALKLGWTMDPVELGGPVYAGGGAIVQADPAVEPLPLSAPGVGAYLLSRGGKRYELEDHLGDVLAVVNDLKLGNEVGAADGDVEWYAADISRMQDYYPFGMEMPKRGYVGEEYRYGFQRQEKDNEWNGSGAMLAFEYRVHDVRLGRFLSVDPLSDSYPWNSSYAFSENRVVDSKELEGAERLYTVNRWTKGECGLIKTSSKTTEKSIPGNLGNGTLFTNIVYAKNAEGKLVAESSYRYYHDPSLPKEYRNSDFPIPSASIVAYSPGIVNEDGIRLQGGSGNMKLYVELELQISVYAAAKFGETKFKVPLVGLKGSVSYNKTCPGWDSDWDFIWPADAYISQKIPLIAGLELDARAYPFKGLEQDHWTPSYRALIGPGGDQPIKPQLDFGVKTDPNEKMPFEQFYGGGRLNSDLKLFEAGLGPLKFSLGSEASVNFRIGFQAMRPKNQIRSGSDSMGN